MFESDSRDGDSGIDTGAQPTAEPAEQWPLEKDYLTGQLDLAEKRNRHNSSELWRLTVKVRGLNSKIRSMDADRQDLIRDRLTLRSEVSQLQDISTRAAKGVERVKVTLERERKGSTSMRLRLDSLVRERDRLGAELRAAREARIAITTLRGRVLALEKITDDYERRNESLLQLQSEANLRVAALAGICRRRTDVTPPQDAAVASSESRTPLSIQQAPRQSSPVSTVGLPFYCYSTQTKSEEDSLKDQLLASGEPASLAKMKAPSSDVRQPPLPLDSPTAKRVRTMRWASAQGPTI
ncbi:unnamed protein product [Tilletia controversa]|nr:unnamed protein product [Tilletia controversa]